MKIDGRLRSFNRRLRGRKIKEEGIVLGYVEKEGDNTKYDPEAWKLHKTWVPIDLTKHENKNVVLVKIGYLDSDGNGFVIGY